MHAFKLTRIGSQLAVLLPPELPDQCGLKEGDTVYLSGTPDGEGLRARQEGLLAADPAAVEQLHAGHQFMRDFHAAFRTLAR